MQHSEDEIQERLQRVLTLWEQAGEVLDRSASARGAAAEEQRRELVAAVQELTRAVVLLGEIDPTYASFSPPLPPERVPEFVEVYREHLRERRELQ